MKIVNFNGLGQPLTEGISQHDTLVLLAEGRAIVVKLNLLPPEQFGSELIHAKNWEDLENEVLEEIKIFHPECFGSNRHWVFECPEEIVPKAHFTD